MIKRRKLGAYTISQRMPEATGRRERIKLYDLVLSLDEFVGEYLKGAVEFSSVIEEPYGFITASPTDLALAIRTLVAHTAEEGLVYLSVSQEGEDRLMLKIGWDSFISPEPAVIRQVKTMLFEAGFDIEARPNSLIMTTKVDKTAAIPVYNVSISVIKNAFYTVFFF